MEQYLIDQYDVIEDKRWLTDVDDIEDYFSDIARDHLECGQGFYQDHTDFICKIGDRFYKVDVFAEIGSAKQDVGDRLYWVEDIENITYREIEKPKPAPVKLLYKLSWDYGRMGDVEGLFVSTNEEVASLIGKEVYFGEILGKHSEVYGVIEEGDITEVDIASEAVTQVAEVLGETWSGYNPFHYIEEEGE